MERHGSLQQRVLARDGKDILCHFADHSAVSIGVSPPSYRENAGPTCGLYNQSEFSCASRTDAVAEARQDSLLALDLLPVSLRIFSNSDLLNVLRHVVWRADLGEHADDRLIGAAVRRTVQALAAGRDSAGPSETLQLVLRTCRDRRAKTRPWQISEARGLSRTCSTEAADAFISWSACRMNL